VKGEKGKDLKRAAPEAVSESARKSRRGGASHEGAGDKGQKGESEVTTEPANSKRTRSSHTLASSSESGPARDGANEGRERGRGAKSRRVVTDSCAASDTDTGLLPL